MKFYIHNEICRLYACSFTRTPINFGEGHLLGAKESKYHGGMVNLVPTGTYAALHL